MTSHATTRDNLVLEPATPHFAAGVIDGIPAMLEASYRLRYEVYCHERKFLNAADYPNGLEVDEFDRYSIHVGAVDTAGLLAGTARIVVPSDRGVPLQRHCTLYPDELQLLQQRTTVELSRLSVSRHYRRRRTDDEYGFNVPSAPNPPNESYHHDRRRIDGELFFALMKALCRASRRAGFTHWLAATEKSLQRLLGRIGFSFRQVGPESDYFGKVAPYALDLREIDQR